MNKTYDPLFTPWKIGNVEIKNRIVMTSMGGTSIFGWMEPNHFDKEAARFLLERAKNNAGLILPGIAPIRDILLGKWLYQGKGKFDELKDFMEEFHKTGCKMFIQLTAGFGRSLAINDIMVKAMHNKALATVMKPVLDVSYLTASASATPNRWEDSCISRPLTTKEIHQMVDAFAKTAKLCKDAGVDGIEVHAVHEGYLLDQFTMKYTNFRTDEYGGSFENRYRFPVEIVKAIKAACGDDFPVSLRYSVLSKTKGFGKGALPGEDYVEVGRDMEESERAAKYLQDAGYDMLNCDNGTYDAWYWAHPAPYMPRNCNLEDVAHIKKFVDIPVVCAGRMDPAVGAEAIAQGKIDGVGIARQFLSDPEWINGPDPLHGFVRKHFLQLHDLLSYREQRFLPCNKIVVVDGDAEAFYPLAYGMLFGTISALNGVDDILDPGTLNGVRIRFFRIQLYAAAQWEQGANRRLCIMNRTFPVPEQRATLNRSPRLEPYNGDSGVLSQIYLAILCNGVPWRKSQFLGYVVEVFGIQENILPVDAAFPALLAVKTKMLIRSDTHLVVVLHYVL